MTFLPVVERELRVASRTRGTYWSRFAAAVIGVGLGSWILLVDQHAAPAVLGHELFGALSAVIFIYTAVAGLHVTFDSLSEEKREGTLGLLFLTDLRGHDIVLGKLAATSLNVFYGTLAVVPVLAVPLLLGGVTHAEFGRVVLVAINLLLLSLSAGLLSSSVCRDDRKALSMAVLIVTGVLFSPLLLAWWAEKGIFLLASPVMGCFSAFDRAYKARDSYFWMTSVFTFGYTVVCFVLACAIAPRSWQDATTRSAQASEKNGRRRQFASGMELRRQLLNCHPFSWRANRGWGKQTLVWCFLALVGLFWVWLRKLAQTEWFDPALNCVAAILLHLGLKFWVASESARQIVQDRRSGALELLLATPLGPQGVIDGQRHALWRQFAGPLTAVLLVDLVFLYTAFSKTHGSERTDWMMFYIIAGTFLVLDVVSLSWVGMWQALIRKTGNRAGNFAFGQVVFLPAAVCVGMITVWGIMAANSVFFDFGARGFAVVWCALGIGADVYLASQAKRKLLRYFREAAVQRFSAVLQLNSKGCGL